jgi:hypothetical protein
MKAREEKRRYWSRLVARFEESGQSQTRFTTEAGVGVAAFRYWLYRLRREGRASTTELRSRETDNVRLVPVEVRRRPSGLARLELRVAGLRVLVPVGTDPRYLAQVAVALRDTAAC